VTIIVMGRHAHSLRTGGSNCERRDEALPAAMSALVAVRFIFDTALLIRAESVTEPVDAAKWALGHKEWPLYVPFYQ
jgi:hypothetical protein